MQHMALRLLAHWPCLHFWPCIESRSEHRKLAYVHSCCKDSGGMEAELAAIAQLESGLVGQRRRTPLLCSDPSLPDRLTLHLLNCCC